MVLKLVAQLRTISPQEHGLMLLTAETQINKICDFENDQTIIKTALVLALVTEVIWNECKFGSFEGMPEFSSQRNAKSN